MDRAFAYVSCSEEDSRVKVQKYCRKIYELGYIPICPRFGFVPFLDESNAEDQQGLADQLHQPFIPIHRIVCEPDESFSRKIILKQPDRDFLKFVFGTS